MSFKLFGFNIGKQEEPVYPSFEPRTEDDGALVVNTSGSQGTFASAYIDIEGSARNEAELISRYREASLTPECEAAIDDIVNEAIVKEENEHVVNIVLDDLDQPDRIKQAIEKEFENILVLLNFNNNAYDIFKRWYIDGRINYHVIIDEKCPRNGIQELRYVDPRKLRKIRTVKEDRKPGDNGATSTVTTGEFYLYTGKTYSPKTSMMNSTSLGDSANAGLQIAKDSIIFCTSGLVDKDNKMVLSYLHKALKPLNGLRMLEDASIIYFLTRAPERRIFYIDVGNLPKLKAEQHLKDMMTKHKNRVVYDSATGEVRDDRKFMTMMEDFWLPRRGDGKATEITTLQGGTQLTQLLENLVYFKGKLYKSLNVPVSRLNDDDGFSLGRATEINRDELKFQKFINRLRLRFGHGLLFAALEKQLVLKGIITTEDWKDFKNKIHLKFNTDNYFAELKDSELLKDRLATLAEIDSYIGRFFSNEWVKKNVLKQNEEDVVQIKMQIDQEKAADPDAFPTLNGILSQNQANLAQAQMGPQGFGDDGGMEAGGDPSQGFPPPKMPNQSPETEDDIKDFGPINNNNAKEKQPPKFKGMQ